MALLIPYRELSAAALQGLIEEYVTRDGTDYGEQEIPLAERVAEVRRRLESGEVVIQFSEVEQSCTLALAASCY